MTPPSDPRGAPGRVLVTDGEFKHSLGIVRRLFRLGHEVHVSARSDSAPAIHSRAIRGWHLLPPANHPSYDAELRALAGRLAPVSLVAVGSGTMAAADRLRGHWPRSVGVAIPPAESFALANDKARTAALARSLGVRVPRERVAGSRDEARAALAEFGAPLVLKSAREEGRKVLRYVRSEADADRAFDAVRAASSAGVLAQEFIAGEGYGFSALYWEGRRVRSFMHRRVREWPPSGGTSACAVSVPEAPELERAGSSLLDALRWHGVAMVEFKGAPEAGALSLIEINAKFWGSHDVSLAAGVDFPGTMVALLEGRDPGPARPARRVRFSWPLGGDLWHGLFRPASLPRVLWDAVSPGVAHSFQLGDLVPHLYEALQWVRSFPGAYREQREMR